MQAVLRAYYEGIPDPVCISEDSFPDMHRALGNKAEQDYIRMQSPGNHCWRLIEDPLACVACQTNPYNGPNGDLYRTLDNSCINIDEAFRLQIAAQSGLVADLTSDELEILTVMNRSRPIMEAELLSKMIAVEVSKIFASPEK